MTKFKRNFKRFCHTILPVYSFKKKLMVLFLAVGLLPLITVSFLYQNILNREIVKTAETASIDKLRYLNFNIKRQAETAQQLLSWIANNQRLNTILTTSYDELYQKQLDIIEFSSYVTEYSINANVENNIIKILVIDNHGTSFQMGNSFSFLNTETILHDGWMELYQKNFADELTLSQDLYLNDDYVFPLSRQIYDNLTGKPIGWVLITFKNTMYSEHLIAGAGEKLFVLNENGQFIANAEPEFIGTSLPSDPLIQEILHSSQEIGNVTGNYEGQHSILHYYKIPDTSMTTVLMTSMENFLSEKQMMTRLAAVLIAGTTAIILLLIIYLGNRLTRPINTICNYIRRVPENGLQGTLSLKNDDEFKKIAEAINTMEREVLDLMDKQREEAETKKRLEFKVLQNQINPHFLYNTLNSIKWMATLQHADTIRDMTAALGRLLQNIARGADSKIPIYEEMSLLDDYVLIQNIRYDGKINVRYKIGNPNITQAYIIKFLLQPIVENAIFHGIEPKEGAGNIDIFLESQGDDILISIVDDGIGMTQEQISQLLDSKSDHPNSRGLNGIGISNIHERIRMTYGARYGLSISSQPGIYTKVVITIPYEKEG